MTIHSPPPILAGVRLGDSISVSGTCLTVTKFDSAEATFTVGLAPETLRRTTLGLLVAGSRVNLERAMGGGGADDGPARFGGHYVQGHVDCVAEVRHVQMDGESRRMRFAPTGYGSHGLMRYIVEKGFICVDGASLTVTAVGSGGGGGGGDGGGDGGDGGGGGGDSSDGGGSSGHAAGDGGWFEVMLVAYTQEKIVTAKKSVGELVNIEEDLTGKLVEVNCLLVFLFLLLFPFPSPSYISPYPPSLT